MKLTIGVNLLESFSQFLMDSKLGGKKSRLRSRFFNKLEERHKQFQQEYQDLVAEFSDKDEKGEMIKSQDEEGNEIVTINDMLTFQKEVEELLLEVVLFEIDEELKDILEEIFLETEKEFEGLSAIQYDKWCEAIEGIK